MNVYLAGKVDERFGSWRNWIVKSRWHYRLNRELPFWIIVGDSLDVEPWIPISDGVFRLHTYVGPFRQIEAPPGTPIKNSGEFHGTTTHGQHGMVDNARDDIILNARRAISQADLVFAYINNPDAYGTIAEIGYAAALGKFVSVLTHGDAGFEWDDFWFVTGLADHSQEYGFPQFLAEVKGLDGQWEQERTAVTNAVKDAFIAYAAWESRRLPVPVNREQNVLALREVAQSFQQISQWTSDPRVRGEAQQMLRRLIGGG